MAIWTLIALAAVLGGTPATTSCGQNAAVRCDRGEPVGDLGIDGLRCNCTVSSDPGRRSWSFRDAPEVRAVDPEGPAAGRLEPGDVLTALGGLAMTQAEAGVRFANLRPGERVVLTVRRDGRERTVEVVPDAICPEDRSGLEHVTPVPSAPRVGAGGPAGKGPLPAVPALPPSMPTGWFGFGLQCRDCGWEQESGTPRVAWHFEAPPVVYRVDPGGPAAKAGIRAGDTVLMIEGEPLSTAAGGMRFGGVQPGDLARLTIGRAGGRETIAVTARPTPSVVGAPSGGTPSPDAPSPAQVPTPAPRNPRYQGSVGNARIEVLGSGSVIVNVPAPGREVEIITGDATIRIRTPEPDDR